MIRSIEKTAIRGSALAAVAAALISGCANDVTVLGTDDRGQADETRFVRVAEAVPGRYIVMLEAPKDPVLRARVDVQAVVEQLSSRYTARSRQTWSAAFHGFVAEMSEDDALALAQDPQVALVQQDGVRRISTTQQNATWGLDRIDQRDLPVDGAYAFDKDGRGVTAYVIDTGVRTSHSDFGGRARAGFSAIEDGKGSEDCNGHGTHVAGTIGGTTWGVAKGVDLVAVRVLGCDGSGTDSGVIAGVDWVARNARGPSVANMSLGGGASPALDAAVQRAIDAGVTFVVAAGNEDADACNGSPSGLSDAITVGASNARDRRAGFSNWGRCVDVLAPGEAIESAAFSSDTATDVLSGTSMASPHVAGAVALYLAANPDASPAVIGNALRANATSGKIADLKGSPNVLLYTGGDGDGGGGDGGGGNGGGDGTAPDEGTPQQISADGSAPRGRWVRYEALDVLPGSTLVATTSGTGDADLYVRFDAAPTTRTSDCASASDTSDEVCELSVPAGATKAFVAVLGYTSATFHLELAWVKPTP